MSIFWAIYLAVSVSILVFLTVITVSSDGYDDARDILLVAVSIVFISLSWMVIIPMSAYVLVNCQEWLKELINGDPSDKEEPVTSEEES